MPLRDCINPLRLLSRLHSRRLSKKKFIQKVCEQTSSKWFPVACSWEKLCLIWLLTKRCYRASNWKLYFRLLSTRSLKLLHNEKRVSSQPCLISISARLVLQLNIATCNGVLSSAVFAVMSAPWRSKVWQISLSPLMQTRCKAVSPTCVLVFTSISVSRTSMYTISLLRLRTAWCRALLFKESTSDGRAPELRRTSATSGQLNLQMAIYEGETSMSYIEGHFPRLRRFTEARVEFGG